MKDVEVMYLIHHHEPITAAEIAKITNGEPRQARQAVKRAFEAGVVVRRTRRNAGNKGTDPYEYAIAPAADDWNIPDRPDVDEDEIADLASG